MSVDTRKPLWVNPETHLLAKIKAAQNKTTIKKYLHELIQSDEDKV